MKIKKIIVDEFPTSCFMCELCQNLECCRGLVDITFDIQYPTENRHENCPLELDEKKK